MGSGSGQPSNKTDYPIPYIGIFILIAFIFTIAIIIAVTILIKHYNNKLLNEIKNIYIKEDDEESKSKKTD